MSHLVFATALHSLVLKVLGQMRLRAAQQLVAAPVVKVFFEVLYSIAGSPSWAVAAAASAFLLSHSSPVQVPAPAILTHRAQH